MIPMSFGQTNGAFKMAGNRVDNHVSYNDNMKNNGSIY